MRPRALLVCVYCRQPVYLVQDVRGARFLIDHYGVRHCLTHARFTR
jgi:hypothetical protein